MAEMWLREEVKTRIFIAFFNKGRKWVLMNVLALFLCKL
jgi:hypothetical protein